MRDSESGLDLFSVFPSEQEERTAGELLFEKNYSQYFSALIRHATNYVEYREVAEDIVQELYSELWENRHELNRLSSPKSYLYRSVTNKCLNYLRDHRDRYSLLDDTADSKTISRLSEEEIRNNDIRAEETEIYELLTKCIDELSPRSREVMLYALEGYSVADIAKKMGIGTETVKTLKKRSYASIRRSLGLE